MKMQWFKNSSAVISLIILTISSFHSFGQSGGPIVYKIDWRERLTPNLGLKPHDHNLLGDHIDLHTGRLSFEHVDVSLPGNSSLPVEFRRRFNPSQSTSNEMKDWQLAVPTISTKINDTEINVRWGKQRCTQPLESAIPISNSSRILHQYARQLSPSEYSGGVLLDVPGRSSGQLLNKTVTGSWPQSAQKVTTDGWYFTCISNIDGAGTEGFYGFAPNGDRYTFNIKKLQKSVTVTEMWDISYYANAPARSAYATLAIHSDILAASEVTDVHGNWVRYSYDTAGNLTRIYANDGREITVNWAGGGTQPVVIGNNVVQMEIPYEISSIVANPGTTNEKRWSYQYASSNSQLTIFTPPTTPNGLPSTRTAAAAVGLRTVTLPNGRTWQFDLAGARVQAVAGDTYDTLPGGVKVNCVQQPQVAFVTHPDGATGRFDLAEKSRAISFKTMSQYGPPCPNTTLSRPSNIKADVMTVVKKTLSGPGISTAMWEFDYYNMDDPRLPSGSGAFNRTYIKQPDGSKKIVTYAIPVDYSSQLLKEELFENWNSSTPLESIEYTYIVEQKLGAGFVSSDLSDVTSPLRKTETTITRNGDWYKTRLTYNTDRTSASYSYGYPTKTEQWSSLNNGTRITDVTYLKDDDDWILGLIDTVTKNSKLFEDFDYDTKGRLITHKEFGTTVASLTYHTSGDQAGQLYSYTDALNRQTTFSSYYRGIPRTITRPDNSQVSYQIDENGWTTAITNGRGFTTRYQYDAVGRLTYIDLPEPWTHADIGISYSYSSGNLIQTLTKSGETTTTTYDAMLRQKQVSRIAADGNTIYSNKNYDTMGREIFVSLPGSGSPSIYGTSTRYDALGRVVQTQETAPGGGSVFYEYLAGNKTRTTDAMGNVTITSSSGFGNPVDGKSLKIEKPQGITTDFSYDIYGNLLTLAQLKSDGTNHISQYFYDNTLRLCRVSIPEKGDTLFAYNNANEKTEYAEGQVSGSTCSAIPTEMRVGLSYDLLGRLSTTDYPGTTPDISRTYDANGNLLTLNRSGVNWIYTYNSLDMLNTENLTIDGRNYGIGYSYNPNATLSILSTPGRSFNYSTDSFGRVKHIMSHGQQVFHNITYHPNGKLNTLTRRLSGTYEQRLNERQLTSFIGGNWGDNRYYYYNANGQITQIDSVAYNVYDRTFGYDGASRLTSATGPWGSASYQYDKLGNITQKTEGSRVVDLQYNTANLITNARDSAAGNTWRSYSHDARGNVTSDGRHNFVYDFANQPESVSGASSGNYAYDGHFRRVKQTVGGQTIYSIYDKSGTLIMRDNVTRGEKTSYVSLAGQIFATVKNGVISYPLNDHLGTAIMEADENGNVAANQVYNYNPFGENINHLPFGTQGNDPGTNNEKGFTGHIEDTTGLVYMQARYYDPVIGRFLSTDPIGYEDQLNLYAYVGNDPVNNLDPSGMNTVAGAAAGCAATGPACPAGAVVGAVAGTVAGAAVANAASEALSGKAEGIPEPTTDGPDMEPSDISEPGDKPSLLDDKGRIHTLDGDATGGGHRPGTGLPGKSEFPEGWSDGKIEGEISDVATAPDSPWSTPNGKGYSTAEGERDGVKIKTVIDVRNGRIVTGYPTNTPRNPR